MPSSINEVPVNVSGYILGGAITVAFAMAMGIAWALLSPLANAVLAPGKLITEGFRKPVQHLEGGIIREILVKEGVQVEKGAALIRLEETKPRAEVAALSNRMVTLRALEARLAAEEVRAEGVRFSPELIEAANAQNASAVLDDQREIFVTRRRTLLDRLSALDRRQHQLTNQRDALQRQADADARQSQLAKQESEDYRQLYKEGYGLKNRLLNLDRQVEALYGQIARTMADKAEVEALLEQNQLERYQIIREYAESAAQRRLEVKQELFETTERLRVSADALSRATIRAPASGRVFNLRKHAPGAVIGAGETVLEIVPDDAVLIAEVRIDPKDIDRVQAGQKAMLRFPSLDLSRVAELDGNVELVSSDRIEDTAGQQIYYVAQIRISVDPTDKLGELILRPGVPVEVYIVTGSRNAFSYLARPLIDNVTQSLRQR